MSALTLLAQAGSNVGAGMIQGGWSYVWASYGIAYGSMALYALALWRRYRSSSEASGPQGKE
jgi:hypothetical protein